MTADKLCAGRHGLWSPARNVKGPVLPVLPVVTRVRRRCRCHVPYRFDVTFSDGRLCRYLPGDRVDAVEVAS